MNAVVYSPHGHGPGCFFIGLIALQMPNDNAPLLAAESESAPDVPMPGDDPEAREPHGSHDEHMPGAF